MFPASAARFVFCLVAALLVVLGRQPEAVVRGEDSVSRDMVVVTSGTMADEEKEPGFWASFRTYMLGEHNAHKHDWHHRFFNRYVPLFGVITLSLVAIALCLSYWCQDRNSPETESSRARLEEMRRMQCGERVAMYTMPPSTDTYTQQGCPGHVSQDFYGYPPPPPRYNYATFDPTAPATVPLQPLQPSAPPAYRLR
ncbi:uncharacterized protein LOC119372098 isoform X2 [Rhipicephalus sanguineus]|uniref:uncharacterized protein LOC119372098 isoform X2 n=1 Tax=Rhipicephalus sanguineus TaxID=34632 RepID=UPI0020C5ACD7|nr:uncharacterized protein LOC119372098 isoform X2 [Rhipicephalus sanguineus]